MKRLNVGSKGLSRGVPRRAQIGTQVYLAMVVIPREPLSLPESGPCIDITFQQAQERILAFSSPLNLIYGK